MTKLENMTLKELVTYNTNQYKLSNYGRPWMSTKAEKAYKNFSESKKILKSIRNLTNPLIDNYIWNYKTSSILTNIFHTSKIRRGRISYGFCYLFMAILKFIRKGMKKKNKLNQMRHSKQKLFLQYNKIKTPPK